MANVANLSPKVGSILRLVQLGKHSITESIRNLEHGIIRGMYSYLGNELDTLI